MVALELAAMLGDFAPQEERRPRRQVIGQKIGMSPRLWTHYELQVTDEGKITRDSREFRIGEYWRPFTASLIHVGVIHAFFNIYWFVIFGNVLERRYGPWRFLGMIVFLAYFSMMLQFIVSNFNYFRCDQWPVIGNLGRFFPQKEAYIGCAGFSGVGFGLFGFLWYARIKCREFAWVCNQATVQAFLIWFLICLFLTGSGMLPIANTAHGAGLVLGYTLARTFYSPTKKERFSWQGLAILLLILTILMLVVTPPRLWEFIYK